MYSSIALKKSLSQKRIYKLQEELQYAIDNTDRATIMEWAKKTLRLFLSSFTRRINGTAKGIIGLATILKKETKNLLESAQNKQIIDYIKTKSYDTFNTLKDKQENTAKVIKEKFLENPSSAIMELFVAILGFYLGSGGIDGDGGIPDLDLMEGHQAMMGANAFAETIDVTKKKKKDSSKSDGKEIHSNLKNKLKEFFTWKRKKQ
ncbi:MAG TPA: hypothetical protein PLN03_07935 [Spirochaetota bacterium]|nr:hypothetical protein [Spirochaetota bacterium]